MFAPCGIRIESPSAAVRPLRPQPKLGEHHREVLCGDIGYDRAHFESLLACGVVAEQRSDLYIPRCDPWSADTDTKLAAMTARGRAAKPPPHAIPRRSPLAKSADTIMDDLDGDLEVLI